MLPRQDTGGPMVPRSDTGGPMQTYHGAPQTRPGWVYKRCAAFALQGEEDKYRLIYCDQPCVESQNYCDKHAERGFSQCGAFVIQAGQEHLEAEKVRIAKERCNKTCCSIDGLCEEHYRMYRAAAEFTVRSISYLSVPSLNH